MQPSKAAVATAAAAAAAGCKPGLVHPCWPSERAAVRLKARAVAAPAQSLHPLAPTARAAAAQTHPAAGGLHQRGAVASAAGLGAMRLGGARQHSTAGVQSAVMYSEQGQQQWPPAPIAATWSRPSAPLPGPPEGLPSSASTVSATLCPSACWLYLQAHSDTDSSCCGCGGLVSRRQLASTRQAGLPDITDPLH